MKALVVLLAVSGAALANDADLVRCRAIAEVNSRVACYDAIPVASQTPAAPRAIAAAPASAAAAAAAAPAAKAADPAANFGLSADQMRKPEEPNSIESSLVGRISGWGPRTQFQLANGQVWRVSDETSGAITEIDNPKIKIKRNFIGTMFMEIEGTNLSPRVRRVQ